MLSTRVTDKSLSANVIQNLLTNRSKLSELQEQISTGKKINNPSDDPLGSIDVLNSISQLDKIEMYINNISNAQSELEMTDSTLQSALETAQDARDLIVQASNGTNSSDQINLLGASMNQLVQTIKDLGNTRFGDKYVFGGLYTDNPPFVTAGTNGDEVKYVGTPDSTTGAHERNVEIYEGTTIPVNVAGDAVFGQYYTDDSTDPPTVVSSGLIGTLITAAKELNSANPDIESIRSQISEIDNDINTLLSAQAEVGGIESRLDMTDNKLSDDKINVTKFKTEVEGVDLAKAISDMNYQEIALQASLQVSAKVIQPSLLDYI